MKQRILWMLTISLVAIIGLIIFTRSNVSLYNVKEPLFLADSGLYNELNDDNRIFKTGCAFVYKVSFTDSHGKFQSLCLQPQLTGLKSRLIPTTEMLDDDKYCIDHVVLRVHKNMGNTGLGETQTIVKYDFYHGEERIFLGEKTGVIEDSTRVFLHPPRSHFFFYNQFNPFPYVRFPIEAHEYWELEFRIPDHALEMVPRLKNSSLKLAYSLVSKEEYESPWGAENVSVFKATGLNDEIETKSEYYFSEKYGFLRMEFLTIEGITIKMILEDIR